MPKDKRSLPVPFSSYSSAKQSYDVLLARYNKLKSKKESLESDLRKYMMQGYDKYEVSENDLCGGIRKEFSKWLNQWENLIWHIHACRYGDTHKVIINESCLFTRNDDHVKAIETINDRSIPKNTRFCACSVEGLIAWAKGYTTKTKNEQNFADLTIQRLYDDFEELVQQCAVMIQSTIAKIDKKQWTKNSYTLLYGDNFTTPGSKQSPSAKFHPSVEVFLSFTSHAHTGKAIVTSVKGKGTIIKNFIQLPRQVKIDDDDEEEEEVKEEEEKEENNIVIDSKHPSDNEGSGKSTADVLEQTSTEHPPVARVLFRFIEDDKEQKNSHLESSTTTDKQNENCKALAHEITGNNGTNAISIVPLVTPAKSDNIDEVSPITVTQLVPEKIISQAILSYATNKKRRYNGTDDSKISPENNLETTIDRTDTLQDLTSNTFSQQVKLYF
jgi:hypothetical protein